MSSAQSLDAVPAISPTPAPPPSTIPRRKEHHPATAPDPRALRRNIRRTRLGEEVGEGHLLAFLLFGSCDANRTGNGSVNVNVGRGDARCMIDAHELEGRGGKGKTQGQQDDRATRRNGTGEGERGVPMLRCFCWVALNVCSELVCGDVGLL
jgi:hypothetical protein